MTLAPSPAQATPPTAGPATEENKALAKAAETGERVEVVGARTEFSTTYANPDGKSFRLEQSVVPVRARAANGGWVKPDATLEVRQDGSIGPKAATVDVSFSGGGDGAGLARIERTGRSLAMGWPGKLPKPKLDGDTAVYAEVLPGVDLRMTATTEGFRDVLVVKTPQAAANPKLKRVDFGLKTDGLKVSPTERGGLAATDANGRKVFAVPPAMMWDSSGSAAQQPAPPATGRSAAPEATSPFKGPRPGAKHAGLPVALGKGKLSVTPDTKLLGQTDPKAFPVYIDPQVTWGESERTLLRSDGYESYGWGNGTDDRGQGVGKCGTWNGYYCGEGYVQRLYFEFSPTSLAGKHVLDVTFRVTEPWAFQCDPRWVDLVRTNNISASTTWSKRPAALDLMVDRNVSAGRGSLCDPDQPDAPIDFNDNPDEANENLTPTVRDFAAGKFSRLTLEIRAHDESDASAWKRFKNDAVLAVDYVGKPYYPSPHGLVAGTGTVCSKDSTKPSIVSDPTPLVAATVRTYTGGESGAMLRAAFRMERQSGTSMVKDQPDIVSPSTGYIGAGKKATATFPVALAENTLYRVSAWTNSYWNNFQNVLSSGNAGTCYFKVDSTAPKAPTVTAVSTYELCTTTCAPKGGPGVAGTFKFAPAAGDTVTAYEYRRSGQTTWSTTSAGGTLNQSIAPSEPGTYNLEVRAKDSLGRYGATQIVSFLVNEGSGPVGRWHFDEDSGVAIDSSTTVTANQDNATLSASAGRDDRGRRGEIWYDAQGNLLSQPKQDKGLKLNGSSYASTAGPVLETRSAYTVAAWAKLDSKALTVALASQNGTNNSPFWLGYGNSWYFSVKSADAADGASYRGVTAKNPAQLGVWTHVAGTYDPATQQLKLYVNGVLQGSSTLAAAWAAQGPFQIGNVQWSGNPVGFFNGSIDEVAAWQRALTAEEIVTEARLTNPNTNKPDVELVANWDAANASGTTLADSRSGYGHALTLVGGALLDGEALAVDGVTGAATTAGPLVDETGSFSVTADVQLDQGKILTMAPGSVGQVLGQRTADGSSWGLWYEFKAKRTTLDDDLNEITVADGFWHFGRINKDGTTTWVVSDVVAVTDTPVRLTGVFDAHAEDGAAIRLYVGGDLNDRAKQYTALPGSGDFAVGKGVSATNWGHYLPARIGEARVWAGALADEQHVKDVVIGNG
ncbi:LamG domain-containing protein [Streptomyces sp. NPDC048629]|uniref:LamG domain-containing protein n=1 Tax=Streptomyces sp. NPDC048629 TaxID=3154824 RepID=UPI003441D8B8